MATVYTLEGLQATATLAVLANTTAMQMATSDDPLSTLRGAVAGLKGDEVSPFLDMVKVAIASQGAAGAITAEQHNSLQNNVDSEKARFSSLVGRASAGKLTTADKVKSGVWAGLGVASMAASAVHGTRRHNGSVGWGIAWAIMGALFPIITPSIAVAQGFGRPKK